MSDNKKDGSLDFRNITHSQYGGAQTDRMEFSEYQSAKKVFNTNVILRDGYTHFIQTTDGLGRPTNVEYWQATRPAIDKLTMTADVLGSKNGTYFILQEYLTKKTYAFFYVVDGFSTITPGVADEEIAIPIQPNSSGATIAYATAPIVNNLEFFSVKQPKILDNFIEIEYLQFGETTSVDVGTTGFLTTRLQEGTSFKVGEVFLKYDVDGNIIYNGNTLRNLIYNVPEARFDVEFDEIEVSAVAELGPIISKDPTVYNVDMPVAGTEYSLALPLETKRFKLNIRDHKSKYTVSWVSGGPVLTKSPGTVYEEQGLEIVTGKDTLYFTGTRDNLVMEIVAWK